jgi:hypothetical protein
MNNNSIIDESVAALAESFASILADQNCDTAVAMTKTFEQFADHLKSNVVTFDGDSDSDSDIGSHTSDVPR